MSLFDTQFEDLPNILPIFPLTGALLLPRGNLPLNIFEPRYLNMIEDALANDRIIGMIQAENPDDKSDQPILYQMGCAGRITHFEETDDGRFLISLKGVCRFNKIEELPLRQGYRTIKVDWTAFKNDMTVPSDEQIDRTSLFKMLESYFSHQGLEAKWGSLDNAPDERLINSLAMICPFNPVEKQALLEASSLKERADILNTLLEMAALGDDINTSRQ